MVDYVKFKSGISADVNLAILDKLQSLGENVPHSWVPTEPLADQIIRAEVTRMLGRRAMVDDCRHIHLNSSDISGPLHIDDYCGQPWPATSNGFAILSYFPQDTPVEMGPTAIFDGMKLVFGDGPAGTCLLMRHTVYHMAMANLTHKKRYMLKYLFRSQ